MGSYFDDDWRERQRIIHINNQISNLESERTIYENAKTSVEQARTSCSNEKTAWETTVGRFSGKEVKKTDVFEGEMANALETYVNDAKEENNNAITEAGNLVAGLDSQIDKIESKISQLSTQITNWRNQL